MKERIDIIVADTLISENSAKRARLDKVFRLEVADRAPVIVDANLWFIHSARQVSFGEFVSSPRNHLHHSILNFKWRAENVLDDLPVESERVIFQPDFGALRGTEFPIEIDWLVDAPPKTRHPITAPEQIDGLALPDPGGGLNAMKIQFYEGMKAALDDFDVRLNGQPLEVDVTMSHPGGPLPSAFALCGSNLFLWMKTDPERIHRLMEIVTKSHVQCIKYIDSCTGADPYHGVWLGADTGEMLSADMFREFVVPYYNQLWQQYPPPRVFHMCGKIDHLLEILRDEMRVEQLDGFGFPVNRHRLAEVLAGRVVMRGGPHPYMIAAGPPDIVTDECLDYLRTVGSRGGYILSDGFGLMPGTPTHHIDAMVQASQRHARAG